MALFARLLIPHKLTWIAGRLWEGAFLGESGYKLLKAIRAVKKNGSIQLEFLQYQ
jgi:hypothetical protein